jgi:hypothetical protein
MMEFDRSQIKAAAWALVYCLTIAVLFFRGVVLLQHQFHIPFDLEAYHYPLSALVADTLREQGHFPWWNPYSYMGEPFAGNLQASSFYPPTVIVALLGNLLYGHLPYWFVELQLVAHVAWAGFGAWILMRFLRSTQGAALAGASMYQMGAFFASHTQHLGAITGCAWLPFFLASLYRLHEKCNFRWAALSGISLGCMILAGFPAGYLPVFALAPLLYLLWLNQQRLQAALSPRLLIRSILLLGCAVLVGGLLAAVSWLPAYSVSEQSAATTRPLEAAIGGLTAEGLTSFVWPNLFGQLRGDYWLPYENPTMIYYYQGVVAVILLLGGITWLMRSAKALPFLIAAAVSFLWMLGTNSFVSLLFYGLYPASLRKGIYPYCVLAYFSLFLAVLCAMALSAYERGERRRVVSGRPVLLGAGAAAVLGLLVCGSGVFAAPGSPVPARASTAGGSLLLVSAWLGICWLVLRDHTRTDVAARYRVSAALCAIVVLDLVGTSSHSKSNNWQGPLEKVPPVVEFLHERLGKVPEYRMDTSDTGYSWQTSNSLWRVTSANGFNPFVLEDTRAYLSFFSSAPDGRQYNLERLDSPLLDLAGIRYIVTTKPVMGDFHPVYQLGVNVFENPRAFRRFFLVGGVAIVGDAVDAARRIDSRQFDAAKVAVVTRPDAQLLGPLGEPATSDQLGTVEVIKYEPNSIRLRVKALRSAVLIATESYWSEWQATEDGRRIPLVRADGLFRAVPVSAGSHEIVMRIAPRSVYLGGGISLATLILCMIGIVLGGRPHSEVSRDSQGAMGGSRS